MTKLFQIPVKCNYCVDLSVIYTNTSRAFAHLDVTLHIENLLEKRVLRSLTKVMASDGGDSPSLLYLSGVSEANRIMSHNNC